ncbi:hypothetical protein AB6Q13_23830 [Ralstonia solanacearum]|uniref:hypothetical protein n=1 Tax=Ralstonia solanacearum TaxID=305 RepID=UPI002304D911|nr:hypothetical protein [Ralstonia solanacearum]MDB0567599.1 hypothetical protein [Ralstonia solanacearum]MDB0578849.1 hypothetical protein [Ralstonia solanacearum]
MHKFGRKQPFVRENMVTTTASRISGDRAEGRGNIWDNERQNPICIALACKEGTVPTIRTRGDIYLKKPVPAAAISSDVLIHLDQNDSAEPRSVDQLVQRKRYEHLREQVIEHLRTLEMAGPTSQNEYPMGSGWTQFLDGTRGAGKSTFLSSVKFALENDADVKSRMAFIASIDPSRIEHSEIILLVILQHLRKRVENALKEGRRPEDEGLREEWRRAFRGVAGGLSLFVKGYHPLDDLDPDLFLDWGLERASDSTSLRTKLHRLFATACRILGVRALMLAFDDADTDSTHAINLLECVRKYLDVPLVMVLVTGDLELYSLLVRQHFAETVAGKREAALELQRRSVQGDRSAQYLRMIDHLEEQYLLKLFPIRRRTQLQPLWNVMLDANCLTTHPEWVANSRRVEDVVHEIVKRGLRVKTDSDVAIYTEFLLKLPLRSTLQVMAHCAPYLGDPSPSASESALWSNELTTALSRALQGLALTSLYKFSVDTDAIAARELPALVQAVFDLSLLDGDIDTALYLRPMSAERDIKACFAALAAEVPNFCAKQPGMALRYLLRAAGSISLYSLARAHPGVKDLPSSLDLVHQFKSYMGIGRREDSLDWARRATAVIALPYGTNPKARVVLPGVVGLNRKARKLEPTARTVIQLAIDNNEIQRLPVFALSMVDVSGATSTRTYGSIFTLVGLIEKLLSAGSEEEARTIFDRAYPPLTVSAPNWSSQINTEDPEEVETPSKPRQEKHGSEFPKQQKLWEDIREWRTSALLLAGEITPSAIFLGKVWTRLFFSLQKSAEDLKPRSKFSDVMEIFASCVINAFLVEEAEHHVSANPSLTPGSRIDRNNPRTSASAFAKKLQTVQPNRRDFPLTSIVATCPLLLGLLDQNKDFVDALKALFPDETETTSIEALLRPKALADLMEKVAVAGESRTRSRPAAARATTRSGDDADEASEE